MIGTPDVLVDTSVWIDHFRKTDERLVELLESASVLIHPAVLGELAMGHIPDRHATLSALSRLRRPRIATDAETLTLVEVAKLYGEGLGWVDAQLLAAARLTGAELYTRDKTLGRFAS